MRERERGASRAPGDLQPLPRSQSVASWAVRGPAAAAPVTSPHSGCSPGPLAAVSSALHTRLTPSLSLHQPLLTATSLPCPRGGPSRSPTDSSLWPRASPGLHLCTWLSRGLCCPRSETDPRNRSPLPAACWAQLLERRLPGGRAGAAGCPEAMAQAQPAPRPLDGPGRLPQDTKCRCVWVLLGRGPIPSDLLCPPTCLGGAHI